MKGEDDGLIRSLGDGQSGHLLFAKGFSFHTRILELIVRHETQQEDALKASFRLVKGFQHKKVV
jgi:hypothetical protein